MRITICLALTRPSSDGSATRASPSLKEPMAVIGRPFVEGIDEGGTIPVIESDHEVPRQSNPEYSHT